MQSGSKWWNQGTAGQIVSYSHTTHLPQMLPRVSLYWYILIALINISIIHERVTQADFKFSYSFFLFFVTVNSLWKFITGRRRRVEKATVTLKQGISYGATFPGLCLSESLLLLLPWNFKKTTSKMTLISPQEIIINLTYMTGEKPSLWFSPF